MSNNTTSKNQGAITSRLQNVVSPVEVKYPGMPNQQRQAASSKKQDTHNGTTDSDFFALTNEDGESQMDPVLIIKNLSYLNTGTLNSGTTSSGIFVQEAQNESIHKDINTTELKVNHASAPMIREKNAVILSDEQQVDVHQLVVDNNSNGLEINKDHAHIKEFTPIGQNDEKSFQNTEGEEDGDVDEYYASNQNHEKQKEVAIVNFVMYREDEHVEVKSSEEEGGE